MRIMFVTMLVLMKLRKNLAVILIAQVLLGLFPVINFVFAVSVQEMRAGAKHLNTK